LRTGGGSPQAIAALTRAGEEGDVAAQVLLGKALREGVAGLPKDSVAARSWLRRASDGGSASGAYYLAVMTQAGEGATADPPEAVRWLELASARGSAHAAFLLGNAYRSAAGVARNDAKALEQYEIAAERELPAALQALAMAHLYGELGLEPDEAEYRRYALEAEHAIGHPPREP
jgi:TPR repeat protein